MASYHLSAKPISRSAGRSATGAAAYRAGVEITDERTGMVHDYTRKGGVMHAQLILPGGGTADRAEFWNAIELHHKRGDAVLVREVDIALPTELTVEQREALVVSFARELADRYGVAADVALHEPRTVTDRELEKNPDQYHETEPETGRRHNGNWHAHIMLSACHVQPDGTLGKKAVELDPIHCQRAKIENMADRERPRWGELANAALERHGHQARIDHRSHAARGIKAEPTRHLGPAAASFERRTGEKSEKRVGWEQEATERLARAQELGKLERERAALASSLIDLSGDLGAAKREVKSAQLAEILRTATAARQAMEQAKAKDQAARQAELDRIAAQAKTELVSGAADFRARFMADRAAKIEADRRAELAHQAVEFAQGEARRKAELEKIAQEQQREAREAARPGAKKDGPDFSR